MGISRHRRRTVVDEASATAAAEWVLERRTACDDPDLWLFPGTDDLFGVVGFVQRHQRVPDEVLRGDAIASLAILNFLGRELDRRRLATIRMARRCGVPWRELAGPLGVSSYQAAEQVAVRLEALFDGDDGTRDESAGRRVRRRARRRAERADTRPAGGDDPVTTELRDVLGQLLALEEELPDDLADDVLDLRREATARRAELTGAQLGNALRVVANAMRGRDWPAPVRAVLDRLEAALG